MKIDWCYTCNANARHDCEDHIIVSIPVYTKAELDEAVKEAKIEGHMVGMLDSWLSDKEADRMHKRYIKELENG